MKIRGGVNRSFPTAATCIHKSQQHQHRLRQHYHLKHQDNATHKQKKNANTTNLITTDTDNATLITYIREHTDSTKEDFVLPYTHTHNTPPAHI